VGEIALKNVDITDSLVDGLDSWTCVPALPVASLAVGGSIVCTATYTITEADLEVDSVPNVACVDSDETPEVCDDLDIPKAKLVIEKEADVTSYSEVGDEIDYTITATNVGEIALTNVDITDSLVDGLDSWTCVPALPVASLAVGDSIVCTATYVITEADLEAGSVPNVACVDSDETPEVCDDLDIPVAKLVIVKEADVTTFDEVGDVITYTITATNVGDTALSNVVVTDEMLEITLSDFTCEPAVPVTSLAVGDSIVCTGTYTITQADLDAGYVLNTACADSDETPRVCDDKDIPGEKEISLVVEKTAGVPVVPIEGGNVTFTYVVTNTSPISVVIESLSDDKFGVLEGDEDCQVGTILAPGASCEFEATFFVEPDEVADPPQDTLPHVNVFTACVADASVAPDAAAAEPLDPVCDDDDALVGFIGGAGGGGGSGQPPTDMLLPTATAADDGQPLDPRLSWSLWLALSAVLILLSGWVVREQRRQRI
jgi:uncharacterized repeat protein (TIGR01451 family)